MNKSIEKPERLDDAFSLLENGKPIKIDTMDAIRILQNTLTASYEVHFNIPTNGFTVIVPVDQPET